jgi:sn-glycerol 3-phosphate transport system substrate-binding protein
MKKIVVLLMVMVLTLTAAACGAGNVETASSNGTNNSKSTASKNTESGSKEQSNEPVEIDLWYPYGGTNGEAVEELVSKFNAAQAKVIVKATFQGDYYENHAKVLAAIPAGNQPDVTMIEIASTGAFAEPGALENLAPYAERDGVDLNDYWPGLMLNSYWNDELVSLPFFRSTPIMYMNVSMLKEAGLDPAGPKTWEELKEYARALTIKDERWGFTTPIDIWFYEALTFQGGGDIMSNDGKEILFNSPEGIAPVKLWKEMIDEGIMKFPAGEKYNAWTVADTDFFNQQVGLMFGSTGGLSGRIEQAKGKFELGTAFLPMDKQYGVPTGGANVVILSASKKKEAAWEFVKWLTATEQAAFGSMASGYMPTSKSAAELPEMKELYENTPQFKVALDQLEYARPRPMAPAYKEMQETIMTELQRAVIDEGVTAEQAIENAVTKGQKLLK